MSLEELQKLSINQVELNRRGHSSLSNECDGDDDGCVDGWDPDDDCSTANG